MTDETQTKIVIGGMFCETGYNVGEIPKKQMRKNLIRQLWLNSEKFSQEYI